MTMSDEVAKRHRRPAERVGPIDPDTLYPGPEVAAWFGSSWPTWLNSRAAGADHPVATKVSNRIYYRGADLIAWLDSRRDAVAS